MANSYKEYITKAGITNYAAPETIDDAYISLTLDGVNKEQDDVGDPWSISNGDVVFDSAPTAGQALRITRTTDALAIYKTFGDGPLDNADMNKSFRKILHIEQESYDQFIETSTLFQNTGDLPAPGAAEGDNYFLITENRTWQIKSPNIARNAMGLGTADDVTFGSVNATSEVKSPFVSGTTASIDDLTVTGTLQADLALSGPGTEATIIRTEAGKDLFIHQTDSTKEIQLKNDGATWRLLDHGVITNYDTLPSVYASTDYRGLVLSGNSFILADNTPKAWGRITTPTTISDGFGVSAVTNDSTGVYTLDLSAGVVPNANYIVYVCGNESTAYNYCVTNETENDFKVRVFNTGGTAADPTKFTFIII
jgi:hypothetical protein